MRQQIQGYFVGGLIIILSLVNAFLTGDIVKVIAGAAAFLGILSLLITYTSEQRYQETRRLAEAAYRNRPREIGPPSSRSQPHKNDVS